MPGAGTVPVALTDGATAGIAWSAQQEQTPWQVSGATGTECSTVELERDTRAATKTPSHASQ